MQTTSDKYNAQAVKSMRKVSWAIRFSPTKILDDDVGIFTLNQSLLDGGDVLAANDRTDILPWDKYKYVNITDRLIGMEVTHEELDPYSVSSALADVELNNVDGLFNVGGTSNLSDYILPRRPFKLFMGFRDTVLPLFFGLNENSPKNNRETRTSQWHLIDFLSFLGEREIGSTIMLQDVTTDEALAYIFENEFDLTESQYDLDVGANLIPFFYVTKGTKFKNIAAKLMEAEMGRLYMNELGVIRFRNRYNYDLTPVMKFTMANTIQWVQSSDEEIINSIQITANPREVQEDIKVYSDENLVDFAAGETKDIWIEFEDPVVNGTVTSPSYSATEVSGASHYVASSSQITLENIDVFAESAKLTFKNNDAAEQSISALVLYGDAAKPIYREPINIIEQDDASVAKYEEQWYPSFEGIENDYIQSETAAVGLALYILNDYSEIGSIIDLTVRGNPALQLGDAVELELPDISGIFIVTKLVNVIRNGGYEQRIRVKQREQVTFFTLNQSLLNGGDVLGF